MTPDVFDPCLAYGLRFADPSLARCVRETAKMRSENIDELRCFQCGIKELGGIEQLPNLLRVDLHLNEVQDGAPLSALSRLEELHLGLNQASDIRFLKGMRTLKSLTLFDNDIEDIRPLASLQGLEVLHLRFNIIDELEPLRGLTRVKELSISSNLIDDIAPLQGMRQLEVLNLYKNYVSDLSAVEQMPGLREIYAGENPLHDISPLYELKNLVVARVEGTSVPEAHRAYLKDHLNRNRVRLGLAPS